MDLTIQINWCNYGRYKIVDVNDKQHEQVQQFMLEYFRSHRLFQVLKIQQEPDIEKDFLKLVKHILQGESSIIVVDEELNEIKGVALLKCMTKEWRSWTALQCLIESKRLKELYDMVRWCLQQEALHSQTSSGEDSLHIFSFSLCETLSEDKEFLSNFFPAISEVARHMRMPRVTYLSLSQSDRECMESAGFREVVRIIYSLFAVNSRRPFDRLRDINEMYGVFYEKKVPALIPYNAMALRHVETFQTTELPRKSKNTETERISDISRESE